VNADERSDMKRFLVTVSAMALLLLGSLGASPSRADLPDVLVDCSAEVGDPPPGSFGWDLADQNNRWCATERIRAAVSNPAYYAATAANAAAGANPTGNPVTSNPPGDPFRDPRRWVGVRGRSQDVTWKDRVGLVHPGTLYGPLDADGGPYPGIIAPNVQSWVPQVLAEHGYVVFVVDVNAPGQTVPAADFPAAIDAAIGATDYFVATPDDPSPQGESNPWFAELDRTRLGIVGHSGGAGVAIHAAHRDEQDRFDAVVGFDPAGPDLTGLTPHVPTMIQVSDYPGDGLFPGASLYEPRLTRPGTNGYARYTYFDTFRDAGVDTMQVALRAAAHGDWLGAGCVQAFFVGCSLHGEQVASYYMLAWFDRYVRGESDSVAAADGLRRLTTTRTFDGSSDAHSIGTGQFDPYKAQLARNVEAGNVPIMIGGQHVRTRLSFWYPSRYFLDAGALQCEDLRSGCPSP
jgi:dienelactone hydrolase